MAMPRLTRGLFNDLAIWMIVLGLTTGLVFPFFVLLLGVPVEDALSTRFWLASLGAGLGVALANFLLTRLVVGPRLTTLADYMRKVEYAIRNATYSNDWQSCNSELCQVPVDSDDAVGESARAFNDLVDALLQAHEVEAASSDFAQSLSSKLELEQLCAHALDRLLLHTEAAAGAVLIERAGELHIAAQRHLQGVESLYHSAPLRHSLERNQTIELELPEGLAVDAVLCQFRPSAVCMVPLSFKSAPLGLFLLAAPRRFTPHAQRMMKLFQQSFSLALNNALAHDHMQRLAAIDPLTGVYNRRFGLTRLHEEFQRAVRAGAPLGVLILDLDHFKSINDTYGHLTGDKVLVEVAATLRGTIREGDVVVRYGGEEFLVILPGASCSDCQHLAERLRRAIADLRVQSGSQLLGLTTSIGATSYPQDNCDGPEELIQHADEALYGAKNGGRDRISMAS